MEEFLPYIEAAEKVLADAQEKTGYPDMDDCLRDILATPAVDNLGFLSMHAEAAAKSPLSNRFQAAAQGLIDFLKAQGHANILKEDCAINRLTPFFTLNVPEVFSRRPG